MATYKNYSVPFQKTFDPKTPGYTAGNLSTYPQTNYLVGDVQVEIYAAKNDQGEKSKYLRVFSKESYVSLNKLGANDGYERGTFTTSGAIYVSILNHTDKIKECPYSKPDNANGEVSVTDGQEVGFTAKNDGFEFSASASKTKSYVIKDFSLEETGGARGYNKWNYFYTKFRNDQSSLFDTMNALAVPILAQSKCKLKFDILYRFDSDFAEKVDIELGILYEGAITRWSVSSADVIPRHNSTSKQIQVDFSKVSF